MTEADWLAETDPAPMISFIEGKVGDRKHRLYAVACCRLLQERGLLQEPVHHEAIRTTELFADGQATVRELRARRGALLPAHQAQFDSTTPGYASSTLHRALSTRGHVAGFWVSEGCRNAFTSLARGDREWSREVHDAMQAAGDTARATLVSFLRCLHGNPFRPVSVDPSWLISTVVALTEGIYAENAFDRMPILADALQDAGCDNADILTHCRGEGPHVRGCWVVDLLTGRK